MLKQTKSVYIHIPFCSSICSYCDFSKMLYNESIVDKYLISLEKEIKDNYKGELLETLYIGGGTPSALSVKELEKLFKIIEDLNLKNLKEFTIECNVNDINKEKLELFQKNHVNRLSLGIQTFNENVLKKMNRHHTYEEVKEKIDLIKTFKITNINVDLIYAFPHTSLVDLKKDLDLFYSLDITHISTYSLMIEPHTVLAINKLKPISQEADYEMYDYICKYMDEHDFFHYEISNFCKKGYESKHNLVYWNNEHYYGFGLSASGYIDNIRYTNTRNISDYCNNGRIFERETLTLKDETVYALILGFRKIEGIKISDFNEKYKTDLLNNEIIKRNLKKSNLELNNDFLKIPLSKIYIENEILVEVLDYE